MQFVTMADDSYPLSYLLLSVFFALSFGFFAKTLIYVMNYVLKVNVMNILKLLCVTGYMLCTAAHAWAQAHPGPVNSFRPGFNSGRSFPGYNYHTPRPSYYSNHGFYRGHYSYFPEILLGSVIVGAMLSAPPVVYHSHSYTSYAPYPVYTSTYNSYSGPVYTSEPVNSYSYSDPAPGSSNNSDWLYCSQPDGFYPAIRDCPGGWRRVPAQER